MDTYIWLALMLIFLVVEAACAIHLVSIWFAAGSLVAMVVSQLGGPLWLQILLFALVSCGLLACLWPFTKKFLNPHLVKTNVDSVIGAQGYVTTDIDNVRAQGKVKLGSMEWSARSTSGDPIRTGTLVQADRVEGVKVFVSPVKVQETV